MRAFQAQSQHPSNTTHLSYGADRALHFAQSHKASALRVVAIPRPPVSDALRLSAAANTGRRGLRHAENPCPECRPELVRSACGDSTSAYVSPCVRPRKRVVKRVVKRFTPHSLDWLVSVNHGTARTYCSAPTRSQTPTKNRGKSCDLLPGGATWGEIRSLIARCDDFARGCSGTIDGVGLYCPSTSRE